MNAQDIWDYFKTHRNFGKETGMSPTSLVNWKKWGFIPYVSQKKIEKLTNGELKAVWDEKE